MKLKTKHRGVSAYFERKAKSKKKTLLFEIRKEICLSCDKKECFGNCERMRQAKEKSILHKEEHK